MRILAVALSFAFSLSALAEEAKAPPQSAKASQTQHDFEDLLVQGKYHFSDEAVTTVEDDKILDALIGVRADFKDRIKQSSGLY
jgi:hypothetical protein